MKESGRKGFVPPAVPRQAANPPVPMADASPDASQDSFWFSWLKPVLYIGIVLAVFDIVQGFDLVSFFVKNRGSLNQGANTNWIAAGLPLVLFINLGIPILLLVSVLMAFKRNPRARLGLLIYSWIVIGLGVLTVGKMSIEIIRFGWEFFEMSRYLSHIENAIFQAVLPVLLILLLSRPQIKQLFVPAARGFEVETSVDEQPKP